LKSLSTKSWQITNAFIEDPDEVGAFEDWIELYNPGSASIDLTGFYLTDDSTDPKKWQFPTGSTIDAGGELVIWADNDTGQGDTHPSFKLSAGGEIVALYNIDGTTLVDSVTFGAQTTDISYGRFTDGTNNIISMTTPTPGAANISQALVVSATDVSVTEGLTNTFTVKLALRPAGTVAVNVARASGDSDLTVGGGASLTFTSANWNTPQTVTLAAAEDVDLTNGSAIFDVTSSGLPTVIVNGTETDNDVQSLVVSSSAVSVNEDSTNTFTVRLAIEPAANVTVNVVRVSGDTDLTVSGGAALTFTSADWNIPQTVTLAAADDVDLTNGSAVFDVTSSGLTTVSVTGTEVDNDKAFLDVDGNNAADAATDGILILRYLFGFRGDTLTNGAIGASATNSTTATIEAALGESLAMLDVDGDGVRNAATDGILVLRYLFGFLDNTLVAGAIGSNAILTTGEQVKLYLDQFLPGPASTTTAASQVVQTSAVVDAPDDGLVASSGTSPLASSVASTSMTMSSAQTAFERKEDDDDDLFAEPDTEIQQPVLTSPSNDDHLQLDQEFENAVDWLSTI